MTIGGQTSTLYLTFRRSINNSVYYERFYCPNMPLHEHDWMIRTVIDAEVDEYRKGKPKLKANDPYRGFGWGRYRNLVGERVYLIDDTYWTSVGEKAPPVPPDIQRFTKDSEA